MDMIIVKENSSAYNFIWGWLANHPLNKPLEEPMVALNDGEAWQYMGTFRQGNKGVTEFRHRSHPEDNERKYLKVSHDVLDEDIEKVVPIK
jgi:hypothetical protein